MAFYKKDKKTATSAKPDCFLVQSRSDYQSCVQNILSKQNCIIKTVILHPSLNLNDPALLNARVIEENESVKRLDKLWDNGAALFEADIDSHLLPKQLQNLGNTHIAVYPNERISSIDYCGVCSKKESNVMFNN